MKLSVCVFVLVLLPQGRGEGFFSKFMNRKRSESDYVNDQNNVCETVRVMPRIAFAVVGGAPLKSENSAPYISAIGEKLSNGSVAWFCGGSLLSSKDILTAAHCLVSRNVTTVRLGSFSTKKRSTENDYEVSETIIHPEYKITESYNDIAIVKVKDTIRFSKNIKPVCLPEDDKERYEGDRARVIGWGAEEFGGEGSQKLQQVEVEVFTNSNCEKAYKNSTIAPKTFPKGIRREQLCAGSSKGGKDACQGDSGGPLVLTDGRGIVRQIGIVSTGAGCGFKMYPGVYARVSSYTDWIQEQVKIKKPVQNAGNTPKQKNSQNKNNQFSKYKEVKTNQPAVNQSSQYKKYENETNNNNNSSYQHRETNSNAQPPRNDHSPNLPSSEIGESKHFTNNRRPQINSHNGQHSKFTESQEHNHREQLSEYQESHVGNQGRRPFNDHSSISRESYNSKESREQILHKEISTNNKPSEKYYERNPSQNNITHNHPHTSHVSQSHNVDSREQFYPRETHIKNAHTNNYGESQSSAYNHTSDHRSESQHVHTSQNHLTSTINSKDVITSKRYSQQFQEIPNEQLSIDVSQVNQLP